MSHNLGDPRRRVERLYWTVSAASATGAPPTFLAPRSRVIQVWAIAGDRYTTDTVREPR